MDTRFAETISICATAAILTSNEDVMEHHKFKALGKEKELSHCTHKFIAQGRRR